MSKIDRECMRVCVREKLLPYFSYSVCVNMRKKCMCVRKKEYVCACECWINGKCMCVCARVRKKQNYVVNDSVPFSNNQCVYESERERE